MTVKANKKATKEISQHLINEIVADLGMYQHPDLLKVELDVSSADPAKLKKYSRLIFDISYAWKKLLQYPDLFEYLYCSGDEVDDLDALNHHIHAYLEDSITLRNKVKNLLDNAKKDLKKYALNKDDIEEFFKAAIEKNYEVFDQVNTYRVPHRHHGSRFMDGDLIEAENSQTFLQTLDEPYINAMLNQEYKPQVVQRLKQEMSENFGKAKKRWIDTANRNNPEITKYLEFILSGIRPLLYQFLNIVPVKDVLERDKNKHAKN